MYRITGDDTDYPTEDDARAAMREPFLGKTGSWEEDRTSDGSLKVSFVPTDKRAKKQTWTVSRCQETVTA